MRGIFPGNGVGCGWLKGFRSSVTHDQLPNGGHAGLVGTQNIETHTRESADWLYVDNGGVIADAVGRQSFGAAKRKLRVIVNWIKNGENHRRRGLQFNAVT